MKLFITLAALLILFIGCKKTSDAVSRDYSGQFVLTSPIDIPLTGRMHIQFNGVNFTGAGDSALLPYVGTGVFKVSGDSIYFTQTRDVPDLFSHTSVLEGGFLLEQNADSLVFSRKNVEGLIGPEVKYQLHRN